MNSSPAAPRVRGRTLGRAAVGLFALSLFLPAMLPVFGQSGNIGWNLAALSYVGVVMSIDQGFGSPPIIACGLGALGNTLFVVNTIVFLTRSLGGTRGRAPVAFGFACVGAACSAASILPLLPEAVPGPGYLAWVSAAVMLAVASRQLVVRKGEFAALPCFPFTFNRRRHGPPNPTRPEDEANEGRARDVPEKMDESEM